MDFDPDTTATPAPAGSGVVHVRDPKTGRVRRVR